MLYRRGPRAPDIPLSDPVSMSPDGPRDDRSPQRLPQPSRPATGRWAADDPRDAQRHLRRAEWLVPRLAAMATPASVSAPVADPVEPRCPSLDELDGRHLSLPLLWSDDPGGEVGGPLLGHSMVLKRAAPEPGWRRTPPEPGDLHTQPQLVRTPTCVNAREVWPGLILSASPSRDDRAQRDWLAMLATHRVALVLDLRTESERLDPGAAQTLNARRWQCEGARVTTRVQRADWPPIPDSPRLAAIQANERWRADAPRHHLQIDLKDAAGRRCAHACEVAWLPHAAGEPWSVGELEWTAMRALGGGHQAMPGVAPPRLLVQSPRGFQRGAPLLVAIALAQRMQQRLCRIGDGEAWVIDLAHELQTRRGPRAAWSPGQLAPLLALAERWSRNGLPEQAPKWLDKHQSSLSVTASQMLQAPRRLDARKREPPSKTHLLRSKLVEARRSAAPERQQPPPPPVRPRSRPLSERLSGLFDGWRIGVRSTPSASAGSAVTSSVQAAAPSADDRSVRSALDAHPDEAPVRSEAGHRTRHVDADAPTPPSTSTSTSTSPGAAHAPSRRP